MYTRCPACLTVFRISSADLRAADGEVVCGRCDAQFNALTSLSETPEEATVVLRPTGDAEGGDGDLDLSQTGAEPLWDVVARGAVAAGVFSSFLQSHSVLSRGTSAPQAGSGQGTVRAQR